MNKNLNGGGILSDSLFYAVLGAIIGFSVNYFDLSAKKSILLAAAIAAFAGILGRFIL